jgi:hypothetical protein
VSEDEITERLKAIGYELTDLDTQRVSLESERAELVMALESIRVASRRIRSGGLRNPEPEEKN